jgi:hypothetical protein
MLVLYVCDCGVDELVWRDGHGQAYLEKIPGESWSRLWIVRGVAAKSEDS